MNIMDVVGGDAQMMELSQNEHLASWPWRLKWAWFFVGVLVSLLPAEVMSKALI